LKPAPFDYAAAAGSAAAVALLVQAGAGARPLAGGQSLGPMLNLRLARPAALIDLSRAADLRGARDEGDAVVYGAAVTHAEIEDGVVPDATPGWMVAVARRIAYRAVRNRGTIGGSLAHADPAADWVNVLTALDAAVVIAGPRGLRTVPLTGFFTGPLATALAPGEVIAAVRVPKRSAAARWGYWKFCLKAGDFARASAAVLIDPNRSETRILIGAIERPPGLVPAPEALLAGDIRCDDAVRSVAPHIAGESHALHVAALRRAVTLATANLPP